MAVDRETVGWRTVSESVELQREVVARNHAHLNQAKPNPSGVAQDLNSFMGRIDGRKWRT